MKWLLENFWLKVAAFGMGLLVWIHVATEKTHNYELLLPVTEITLEKNLSLAKEPPDSLLVTVSASGKQLLRQKWRERGLRLNIGQYPAGRHIVSLTKGNVSLVLQTADVSLEEVIAPTQIQLDIDIEASASLPVMIDLEATADEGFTVGREISIEPREIMLTGPRSTLSTIRSIATEHRKLSGLRNDVRVTLHLETPPGYGFNLEPDSVAVGLPVFPIRTKVFENLPVTLLNAPRSTHLTVEPQMIRAEVTGPPHDIDNLISNALSVTVDYLLRSGTGRAPVKFDCPPGFHLKYISADSVHIKESVDADTGD